MTTAADPKPLTTGQARCSKAWEMVLAPATGKRQFEFTGQQIADASGVSLRTVTSMREFLQAFRKRQITPSGAWLEDRERAIRMLEDRPARPAPRREERSHVQPWERGRRLVRQVRG